jgi:hypothetical protein
VSDVVRNGKQDKSIQGFGGRPERKRSLGKLGVNGRIILK